MWKRKLQILGEELFQIRTLDVASLFDLNNLEDLV